MDKLCGNYDAKKEVLPLEGAGFLDGWGGGGGLKSRMDDM